MNSYRVGIIKTNRGRVRIENKTPPKLPVTHNFMASSPLPCKSNLWPGKIPSAVESSGAPSKIEGIKLINELITPDVTKMTAVESGPNIDDIPRIIGIVLLGCNPGIKPFIIPNTVPIIKAKNISNIFLERLDNAKP